MIKAVLLDVDNTLLDFDKCADDSIKSACKEVGLKYSHDLFLTFTEVNNSLWKRIEKNQLTKEELHRIRWQTIFDKSGIDGDGLDFEKRFKEHLSNSSVPVEGAKELVCYLHNKNYYLATASNAAHNQQVKRLTGAGIAQYVNAFFTSYEIGIEKPNKGFFDFCLKNLPTENKDEIIIIGDSLTADISGGINCGIKTCFFNKNHASIPENVKIDYVVDNLLDVKKYL